MVVHGNGLEGARAQLRRRHDHMIHWAAVAEKTGDAFIAGYVGRYRSRTELSGSRLQALGIAGGYDNIRAFALCQFSSRKTNAG
jgi:hypothetical protein